MINSNSSSNKRIAKNTLLLYFRMLFMMAVSLFTSRVVLNTLGVEDFGLYNVVGGFVTMFTFLNSAMASATQRYLNFELGKGDSQRLHKVFCTSVNIHLMISVIIFILAETVGLWFVYRYLTIPPARFSSALWVYQFSILSAIVMVMSIPYNATIIAHERMGAFAYISVLEVVLKLLIVYLLVVFDFDKLKLYAVLMFSVQLLIRVIYGQYSGRHFEETKYKWVWEATLFREMTGFAGWNLFGNLALVGFTQGLNILLNMFFGPAVNAARGIAVQVQNTIKGFCQNFQTAINPQITKSYAAGDLKYMHSLIFTSSKFSCYLLLFLSLPVLLETQQILELWLKIVPEHTVSFVRLILIISIIDGMANPLVQAALSTGNIKKYQIVVGTMLLMILPISYIFLKYFGCSSEVVFVVQLGVFVIALLVRVWMLRPMISLSFREYSRAVLLPSGSVCVLSSILPIAISFLEGKGWTVFFLVVVLSFLSVVLSVYTIGLTRTERSFIVDKAKVVYLKVRK